MTTNVPRETASAAVFRDLLSSGILIETDERRLSEYAYDASNYRVRPAGVAFPRSADDVATIARACHEHSVPLTARGGGTSMAGNALGAGIILDFSRWMNRISGFDAAGRQITAEAGVVLSVLRKEVETLSGGALTFAPDPSSQTRATVGGSVANDACGNHSVRHGRMSDHVIALELVTGDGHQLRANSNGLVALNPDDAAAVRRAEDLNDGLRKLAQDNLSDFRLELGRIPRQVSGFQLAQLLPEQGFNVARALVGSEGTCAIVTAATLRIVPKSPSALLLALGYAGAVEAAQDVPTLLEFSPAAIEGIDEAIVETMKVRRGEDSVSALPAGKAWLFVDLDGESAESVALEAKKLLARLELQGRLIDGRIVPDLAERATLWRVREDGAGLSARLAGGGESWPGWEDSAVAPENLAAYLRDFQLLLTKHGYRGVMYGHFGAGCMHVRIDFDLRSDAGVAAFSAFTREAAHLVVRHGGSLSGEHGDGRARSALLPIMYSEAILASFSRFKKLWDPLGILNPGSITDPQPVESNLALQGVPDREWRTHFKLEPAGTGHSQQDPFAHAVQGCVGIGRCRSDSGGVMCPSYRATHDEKDSTRGRARLLQEMVRTAPTTAAGWKSEEVREALDLCLSCKACSSDCPVGVDMATYKAEFFSHYYEGRFRPLSHYSLGWLPLWLRITTRIAPLVNAVLSTPLGPLVSKLGGMTTERALPQFASRKNLQAALSGIDQHPRGQGNTVLFVDSFTKGFRPEVAGAAARVVGEVGGTVSCETDACCGLTWISTGQLGTATKMLRKTIEKLDDGSTSPIIVIEPSCAAALKKDGPELLGTEAAERVASRVQSFAAAVDGWVAQGWTPRNPMPPSVTVQTHCHEYSTFGATVQRKALQSLGIRNVTEATGCCGVAGNFGFEANHFEMSMKVAEQALQPALQATPEETPVLADGFSCAMQIRQIEPDRKSLHIAELLDPSRQN